MHFVTIVGADNVHKVFTDVVNVTLYGGQYQLALCTALASLCHMRFKIGNSGLHGFCALQNERQLHAARAEEFAHFAHAIKKKFIDDVERCNTT